jgi:hypothetical protein
MILGSFHMGVRDSEFMTPLPTLPNLPTCQVPVTQKPSFEPFMILEDVENTLMEEN